MNDIGRYWRAQLPASEAQVRELRRAVHFELPDEYLALLQRTNGGSGPLGLAPLWLQLWNIDQCIERSRSTINARRFPGYFFFADNGAAETLAMRRTAAGSLEVVMLDVLIGPESVEVIAHDFAAFYAAIGK